MEPTAIAPTPTTEIVWRSAELGSSERFTSRPAADGWEMAGLVVLPIDGAPGQISYRIAIDRAWQTRAVEVDVERAGEQRRIALSVAGDRRWLVDGRHHPALDGCVDVDLAFSPATNTLPMRRLMLTDGEEASVPVAWLEFPELRMRRSDQTYARLAADRWGFAVPGFGAEIEVDADGHVLRYGDDAWTAVAHTVR
jgi:hypothetical protein